MRKLFLLIVLFVINHNNIWPQQTDVFCGVTATSGFSGSNSSSSFSSSIPTSGTFRVLIVFCKFIDDNYTLSPNTDLWPGSLNQMPGWGPSIVSNSVQPSYSDPSISGYFKTMSNGAYDFIGDVYFYQPQHNQEYYWISSGRHIGYLVEEILTNLNANNPDLNFADYDNNNDGKVDMIHICFRSANTFRLDGEESYQGFSGLCGNRQTFSSETTLTLDGKTISAAILGSGTFQQNIYSLHDAIGIIGHEFGHYIFPCHYEGIGYHGLMDGQGSGIMNSFERLKLGWITPTVITATDTNITMTDALTTDNIYKIQKPGSSEYFLVENHQRKHFYEANWLKHNGGTLVSPGTGILISHYNNFYVHIESAFGRWDWKKVGNLYVYPFEVDKPNRLTGLTKLLLRDENTTAGPHKNHPDFLGSQEDFFNMNYKRIFSHWSNPASTPDISVILKSNENDNIKAAFYVNENIITENTTFIKDTYTFNYDLIIPYGITLEIKAGATLTFMPGSSLVVKGTLIANGSESEKIIFDFKLPRSTTMNGIKVNSGATLTINQADIYSAYNAISVNGGLINSSNITFTNCTYGYVFNGNVNIQNDLTLPYGVVSAIINSNTTLNFTNNANLIVNGILETNSNLTIPIGHTLYANAGAVLNFKLNKSLIINGGLIADGDYSNRITFNFYSPISGVGRGIKFYSGSNGSLSYCDVKNSYYGVYCNGYLPQISNCIISNNYAGINILNIGSTSTQISNNEIKNNTAYGINCEYSSPVINANKIHDNGTHGIYCYSSAPFVQNNLIQNHNTTGRAGVYLNYYSPAWLLYYQGGQGLNKITNNYWGIYANYQCNANVYWNDIYGNTNYEVRAYQPVTVNAASNYWGMYPPLSTEFYTDSYATIIYLPALANPVTNFNLSKSSNNIAESANHDIINTSSEKTLLNEKLQKALQYQVDGKFKDAFLIYDELLKDEINNDLLNDYILSELYKCYTQLKDGDFINYLNSNIRNKVDKKHKLYKIALELENQQLILEKRIKEAIANFSMILTDYKNDSELYKHALFNSGYIYLTFLEDTLKAKKYFEELQTKYTDDELVTNSKILLGEYVADAIDEGNYNISSEQNINKPSEDKNIPDEYDLIGNFPNPFNPTTTIKYALPAESNVELKIYDLMGREIRTLVNGNNSIGYKEIMWDGKNNSGNQVSSGIYLYRLVAKSLEDGKVFEKSAKMILMK